MPEVTSWWVTHVFLNFLFLQAKSIVSAKIFQFNQWKLWDFRCAKLCVNSAIVTQFYQNEDCLVKHCNKFCTGATLEQSTPNHWKFAWNWAKSEQNFPQPNCSHFNLNSKPHFPIPIFRFSQYFQILCDLKFLNIVWSIVIAIRKLTRYKIMPWTADEKTGKNWGIAHLFFDTAVQYSAVVPCG